MPTAVATSASEMPDMTAAAPAPLGPPTARSEKARMMPTTVPNRPRNGALLPSVPRNERPRSYAGRASAMAQATASWTAAGPAVGGGERRARHLGLEPLRARDVGAGPRPGARP